MRISGFRVFIPFVFAFCASAQNFTYTINTVAGQTDIIDGVAPSATFLRQPQAVVLSGSGDIYIADALDNRVRKITAATGVISTYAGNGNVGYSGDGGRATSASLDYPDGLALDAAGDLFISDSGNNVVRKVSAGGIISTYAGTGSSEPSGDNGQATLASLSTTALALDAAGNLFVADSVNYRIRKIDTTGVITTFAGTGTFGFTGDNGLATAATIGYVTGVATDAAGDLYISDYSNGRIRRVDSKGIITTVAGDGSSSVGVVNGTPTAVAILPIGIATDASGAVYFTDSLNNIVVKLDIVNNTVSTLAGVGVSGFAGDGGIPSLAQFDMPWGIAVDSAGQHIYIADSLNARVREVTQSTVSTVAGAGLQDGAAAIAAFLNLPQSVTFDKSGNMYIADSDNFRIREVAASTGVITTFANLGTIFGAPLGIAVDAAGNVYASTTEHRVVKIAPGSFPIAFAGTGRESFSGDGGPATSATLDTPEGLAVDSAGNLYIADWFNERIRKVAVDGTITTFAGTGDLPLSGDGGPALQAGMDPYALTFDAAGNLYVADNFNYVVRKIDTAGVITTVAGNGELGFSGDRGPATAASLGFPTGVAVDASGALYIADGFNAVVWRVGSTGFISVIAGSGTYTPSNGENIPAVDANIDAEGIAIDAAGNVYVADQTNDRIRKLTGTAITLQSIVVLSGDQQTAGINNALSQPLQVQLKGSDGLAYFGQTVTFQVASGSATLGSASAVTDSNGVAAVTVTLGDAIGPVTITATVAGLQPVTFTAQAVDVPVINVGGITGAGLSNPPVAAVSPGGIFTIFGTLLSAAGVNQGVGTADLVNGALPTNLAGTCVEINGVRAPLFYVSPGQVNAQVPSVSAGSNVPVTVITACDTASAATSAAGSVTIQAVSPEFFYLARSTSNTAAVAAINATTGALVGPSDLITGATPAKTADLISVFGEGWGAVNPLVAPGALATGIASVTSSVTVQLGGVTLDASDILYAGVAPGFAGLYQLNIRVPAGIPNGPQPLIITVGGVASPASAFLQIGN